MAPLNTTADARLCPRCKEENRCAIALGQDANQCWCHGASFNPERVAEYRGLNRCLCERCGTELNSSNPVQHISQTSHRKDSHGQ
ncbi:hypothetical protein FHR99_001368 [Litorivivens lipolytica]|uniref:Cysteine-rich CWC n=1 Tax=Litorivivens lipolytica TaxID=1524264 RepID=A0A7W4Z5H7_9GAMM|nr:cysteine-rich CWC family protein [Litorivivens lipolytica]MBB3047132.1 hypothetical protein [Litorivivens lipolytica]